MREYKILVDTGEARKLVDKINRMRKDGWSVDSISGMGIPTGVHGVYVLMVREVNDDKTVEKLPIENNPDESNLWNNASSRFFRNSTSQF